LHKIFKGTGLIGKKALYLPGCHSTNEVAAKLVAEKKAQHGYVVYTDFQSRGRGQRGNGWESEAGKNILLSIVLDASFIDPDDIFYLTIITSLALHDTLSEFIPHGLKIKWPNDIFYHDRKIAGILIENYIQQNMIQWSIAGMGVNVNQRYFHEKNAISLTQISQQDFDRMELMELLCQKIEPRYRHLKKGQFAALKSDYLYNLYWKDEIHVFQSGGKFFNGRIKGVESNGKLRIETENDEVFFDLKEVVFVK
jgi:BirA family biotin operon repressor/biotin-[acetyl-CoA-carboxylase] ligase